MTGFVTIDPSAFVSLYKLFARYTIVCVFVLLGSISPFGQVSKNSQSTVQDESDLIHFGDIVDVDEVGGFEYDWRGTLTPEGIFDGLNAYGDPIRGLCRSVEDIAADVTKAYGVFLREPKVNVRIIDRSGRAAAVLDGAVKFPHRFQLRRPVTLQELIVLSSGITDDAGGEIQILRPKNLSCAGKLTSNAQVDAGDSVAKSNDSQFTVITISDLLRGKPAANPTIRSGDIIMVRRAVPIYVIGGVVTPRQIAAREKMTLSRAVSSVGGLSKNGDGSQIVIYRRESGETKVIDADLEKIITGTANDPELKAFDIVEVAEKGRSKRGYPPIVTNVRNKGPDVLPLRVVE